MDKRIILALLAIGLLLFALVNFVSAPSKNIEIKDKKEEHIYVVPGTVFCVERTLGSKERITATMAQLFSEGPILESIDLKRTTTETYTVDVPDYGTCVRDVAMNLTTDTRIEQYPCITGYHQEERIREIVSYEPLTDGSYESDKPDKSNKENEVERHRGNLPEKLKGLRNVGHSKDFNIENNATIRMCFKAPEWDSGITSGQISYLAYDDSDYDYESTTWWNSSWSYCKNIQPSVGYADYQYKVVLNASNFDYTHSSGSDLRFLNASCGQGGVELNWWRENWTANGNSTIWFRGDGNTLTNYSLYYGNSGAGDKANGNLTFEFFDAFDGTGLDANKWTVYSGTADVSGGELTMDSPNSRIYNNNAGSSWGPYSLSMRLRSRAPAYGGDGLVKNIGDPSADKAVLIEKAGTIGVFIRDSSWSSNSYSWDSALHTLDYHWTSDFISIYRDGVLIENQNTATNIPSAGLSVFIRGTNYWDWYLVRKYFSPDPIVSIGTEETKPSGEIAQQGSSGTEAVVESNSSGSIILSPASGGKVRFMSSLTDGANEVSIANIKSAYDHSLQDSIKSVVNWQQQCTSCVGADDINANEVQRRVQNFCIGATAIHAIDADGTVTCVDVGSGGSGSGDITDVWPAAGSGLTGGSSSGSASIGTDFNTIQKRVSGVCAVGNSISAIGSDGTVTCEPDDVGSGGVADTNAATICAGTDTYLDGEGNCDDISAVYVKKGGDVMSGDLTINKDRPKLILKTTSPTSGNVIYANDNLYLNPGSSVATTPPTGDEDGDGVISTFECLDRWEKGIIGDFEVLSCMDSSANNLPPTKSVVITAAKLVPAYTQKTNLGDNNLRWNTGYFYKVVNNINTIGDVREYYKENQNYKYEIGTVVAIDTDSEYEIKPLTDVTDRILGVVAELPYNATEIACNEIGCYNTTYRIDTSVAIYGKFSPVKVKGTIQIGDYLVASDEHGVVTSMYDKEHPFNSLAFKKSKNKREYNFNAKMFPTLGIAMENYNSTQVGTIKVVLGK